MTLNFPSLLTWLFDGYWPSDVPDADPGATVRGAARDYTVQQRVAVGDVADIYLATGESGSRYLLKIARVAEGDPFLADEANTLTKLLAAAGKITYRKYLPTLVESIPPMADFPRRVNVFLAEPGLATLEQVHSQHPALDGRHLAWIFKRFLTFLGFCHRQKVVHGAVLPCHVMIDPASHGVQLIGWGHSVRTGQPIKTIPSAYPDWCPAEVLSKQPACAATDIFLSARCIVYLAGGDPASGRMPDAVPLPMQQFVRSCLLESPQMRPHDAWALIDDFDELLRRLYGPPKFHELILR